MGISISMAKVSRLLTPLIYMLIIIPANTYGSVMMFFILYVLMSLIEASINNDVSKIVSTNVNLLPF